MGADDIARALALAAEARARQEGPVRWHGVVELATAVEALAAEVQRLRGLTMAIDLLQVENAALRAAVAKMAPLWYVHQTPPDGVTYTVHQSISSQEQP